MAPLNESVVMRILKHITLVGVMVTTRRCLMRKSVTINRLIIGVFVLLAQIVWVAPSYAAASADGRVYNVSATSGVNIRSCAGTGCSILTTANFGADLLNDASGGTQFANGITWVRVTYRFSSSNLCTNGTESKGWVDASQLSPGQPTVIATAGAKLRSGPSCSSTEYTTVSNGTQLSFLQSDNQWAGKWYEVNRPGFPPTTSSWVQGWQLTDVR